MYKNIKKQKKNDIILLLYNYLQTNEGIHIRLR